VGAEVVSFPNQGTTLPSGGLPLATIPAGATIERATLYGTDFGYNPSGTPSATFAGTSLGTGTLISTFSGTIPEGTYTWRAFTGNGTSLVTSNGNYSASGTGFSSPNLYGSYGMALVVVFSHSSLPNGTVLVNDGIADLSPGHQGPDSDSTSFAA